MTEELKHLIEKIREEGVEAAEGKARAIEEDAGKRAEDIIQKAKKESQSIVAKAKEEAAKTEAATRCTLEQAARDILISLRKEIGSTLDKVALAEIRGSLASQQMADIITALIKEYVKSEEGDVVVTLNKGDVEKVQKSIIGGLKAELKKGVIIRPSEDVMGGFIISFDGAKSHYDFSDNALAEYIGTYVHPKLNELLKGAAKK